jgi:hypothetical protein
VRSVQHLDSNRHSSSIRTLGFLPTQLRRPPARVSKIGERPAKSWGRIETTAERRGELSHFLVVQLDAISDGSRASRAKALERWMNERFYVVPPSSDDGSALLGLPHYPSGERRYLAQ